MRRIIVAALLVTGCVEEELADTDVIGVDGKGDGAGTTLAPTYALELTSTMKMEDRRESDPAKRFSTLVMRARGQVATTTTGNDVKLAVDICDVRLPMAGEYQPELDAAFVTSLPPLQLVGTVERGDTPTLSTQPAALVLGASLANPLSDPLPASGANDQDGDGNPGVSIRIPNHGDIYASLRVALAFSAPLTGASAIAGDADVSLDQVIYGDDIWFYDAVSSAAETAANVALVSATNTIRMTADASTCAKVRAAFP